MNIETKQNVNICSGTSLSDHVFWKETAFLFEELGAGL